MEDKAVGLDMPNGLAKDIDYKQKFVQASNPYEGMPKSNMSMKAPSLDAVLKGIDRD